MCVSFLILYFEAHSVGLKALHLKYYKTNSIFEFFTVPIHLTIRFHSIRIAKVAFLAPQIVKGSLHNGVCHVSHSSIHHSVIIRYRAIFRICVERIICVRCVPALKKSTT
jgi:hypothetical protein